MTQIYCTHCGKRLQADKTISFCTSCGKKLPEVIEEEKTYTDMGALLRGVRDEYGIEVFKDAFKVKGILRDKAPELQKEIQLFSVALDSSAFKDCYSRRGDSSVMTELNKGKFKLMNDKFISKENADRIVDWYCELLDIRTVKNEAPQRTEEPRPIAESVSEADTFVDTTPLVSAPPEQRASQTQPAPVQSQPEPAQKSKKGFLIFYCIAASFYGESITLGLLNVSAFGNSLKFTPVSAGIVIMMTILAVVGIFNRNKWNNVVNIIVSIILVVGFFVALALLAAARA